MALVSAAAEPRFSISAAVVAMAESGAPEMVNCGNVEWE